MQGLRIGAPEGWPPLPRHVPALALRRRVRAGGHLGSGVSPVAAVARQGLRAAGRAAEAVRFPEGAEPATDGRCAACLAALSCVPLLHAWAASPCGALRAPLRIVQKVLTNLLRIVQKVLTHLLVSPAGVDLLIRRYPRRRPHQFRSVRDLGCFPARCSDRSEEPGGRSSVWLPAWLPGWTAYAASEAAPCQLPVTAVLCRGWAASGPGRFRPGPCLLAGVSAETPLDFDCQAAPEVVTRCDQAVVSS